MQEDAFLANLTYLGVAHCDPARAHELPLDEEGLDEGRASAEDGLEGLTPGLANVLQQQRATTTPTPERESAWATGSIPRGRERNGDEREGGGGDKVAERQTERERERGSGGGTRSVTRLTFDSECLRN